MDKKSVRQTLAKNIKLFRNRRNWSQADLAEQAGLSVVYLSDIERGNKWPYLDTMIKLATAFKIEVYELLKPENTPIPDASSVLTAYSCEVTDIVKKTLATVEKQTLQSLTNLCDHYMKSHKTVETDPNFIQNSEKSILT
jgi:transcriptional regulator with XRE-family HTH domain